MAFTVLLVYLVLQFALCFYISRKIDTEADYFVGGRGFGVAVVSISLFATWFGAETCIGASAEVFKHGLSGSRADPFGYSLCLFLSGLLIARKIWNSKYITLADFYRDRFGGATEQLAVLILVLSSLIWAAAQLRAFGQVISATTSFDVETTMLIGFLFVVGYTLLGGLMGDMITDVVQAFVISLGLIALLVAVIWSAPDFTAQLQNITPERLSVIGAGESWLERVDRWAIPIFGSLVAQEIISRIYASKNQKVASTACYSSGFIYLFLGMIPVMLGLIGPHVIQVQGDAEQFLIQLAKSKLSPVMVGVFSGALISALLATIDSILLSAGALVSHNLVMPYAKLKNERHILMLSRGVVLLSGVVAYLLAVYSTGIYDLLEQASSFGTAGILVITLCGLWFRFGDSRASFACLLTGLCTTPIAEHFFEVESPFLASILASLLVYLIVSFLPWNRARTTQLPVKA